MDDFGDDRDETKRKSRNQSEKKRRDQFNVLVSELSSMVSMGNDNSSAARKMDKTTVLLATIDFLKKHGEQAKNLEKPSENENQLSTSKVAPEWKPPFLSNEEFVHLMLEAIDGFVLVLNLCDNGRILYASEAITWLLGHIPSSLMERNVSIYDITADEDVDVLRGALSEKNYSDGLEYEVKRPTVDLFVHIEKGGAHKDKSHALVRLSGYYARWSTSLKRQQNNEKSLLCSDEHCLPPSEDESMSTRSGASSHASKHLTSTSANLGEDGSQVVFICAARLMTPQLLRDMPVVQDAKGEFTSRYSLEWKFLYLDNRAPPIIGYLSFEVLGTSGYDYYHPDDLDKIVQCHEALMQTGEATSCYHRFLTKGQQWIWIQARYFITYHQWNAKPEFVFATHRVISYNEVLDQLKVKSNHIENSHQDELNNTSVQESKSYNDHPSSPTWSSKSSVCGSTGTGITSRQSQSSCRLSGYSDHIAHISSMVPNASNINATMTTRSSSMVEHFNVTTSVPGNNSGNAGGTGPSANSELTFDTFNQAMDTSNTNEDFNAMSGNEILFQANAIQADQTIRPTVFMTPLQVQMHQQLKQKHAELFKKIVEQQEELRKISEQLLMTQYGLVPVSVAPLPFTATTPMQVVSQSSSASVNNSPNVFGTIENMQGYNSQPNNQNLPQSRHLCPP